MENLLAQLEALSRVASDIDGALRTSGVGGYRDAVDLCQRLKDALDAVRLDEIEDMTASIAAVITNLRELEQRVSQVRELKGLVGS